MDILSLIFPKRCLECKREGKYICPSCLKKVRRVGFSRCDGLAGVVSFWKYEGVVRRAIIGLKYKFALEIANELAKLCVRELRNNRYLPEASLVPIPLHWYRENLRGFNQAAAIGKKIAEKMKWKYAPDLLVRKKPTISQTRLQKKERLRNLRGAFAFLPGTPVLRHKGIILFDDVFTTGSTLKEAARVFRRRGVKKIWGLTIAR